MARTVEIRVVSIGTLSAHPLRGEPAGTRTGHATTSLIITDDARVLVDPGLPGPAIAARLGERAGLRADEITHVFLTSFRPETRRGLTAFSNAEWLCSPTEREAAGVPLATDLKRLASISAEHRSDEEREAVAALEHDVAVLQRCRPAPDTIAPGIDLFPLPGYTPGMCGLLVPGARGDWLICGDAVATSEHIAAGKVLSGASDVDQARESFAEALEIADVLIPGRDNMVINPTKRMF